MKFTSIGLGAAIMVCSSFVFCTNNANAGWGHLQGGGSSGVYGAGYGSSGAYSAAYGSSGAYSAAYGSSGGYAAYGSYGASAGGSGGGPGLLARVAGRVRDHLAAKHAYHAARRASYGSSGYYSSVGGSSGGYTSYSSSGGGSSGNYSVGYPAYSGGSSGGVSYGSTGSLNYGSTSSYSGTSVYQAASQTPASTVSSVVSQVAADSVHLTVAVPNDAKIFVNGNATSSTGAVRQFVSRGLEAGKSYKFELRAELQGADGQPMVEEKTLVVSAGGREQLQFEFAEEARPIETAVILNVPEGAKVRLSGSETKATGQTRTFRTSQLAPGQAWDDYEIQVQLGDEIKSQTIRLIAGDKLQLTFNFDDTADKIAAR